MEIAGNHMYMNEILCSLWLYTTISTLFLFKPLIRPLISFRQIPTEEILKKDSVVRFSWSLFVLADQANTGQASTTKNVD